MYKKFLTLTLALLLSIPSTMFLVKADHNQKFIVTAYYSPLPNQTHYIMGSYTAEIRMNGEGIRGASGKKVFPGMLAAPSKYAFGTKISLNGLGIGEVADRGGAIVQAGQRNFKHDRIDIWVGWGEQGLQRAMYWGNRTVSGKVISPKSNINLPLSSIPAPKRTIGYAKKNPDYVNPKVYAATPEKTKDIIISQTASFTQEDIFAGAIKDSQGVKQLQQKLTEMRLYTGKIDGEYSSVRTSVLEFQLLYKVIKDTKDMGAGNYGPATRKALEKYYKDFLEKQKDIQQKEDEEKKKQEKVAKKRKQEEEKYKAKLIITHKQIQALGYMKKGGISPQIRELQLILKKLGFFEYKDTAIFGEKTRQALINYQISKKLITDASSHGAGIFGPGTKKSLAEDLARL